MTALQNNERKSRNSWFGSVSSSMKRSSLVHAYSKLGGGGSQIMNDVRPVMGGRALLYFSLELGGRGATKWRVPR